MAGHEAHVTALMAKLPAVCLNMPLCNLQQRREAFATMQPVADVRVIFRARSTLHIMASSMAEACPS